MWDEKFPSMLAYVMFCLVDNTRLSDLTCKIYIAKVYIHGWNDEKKIEE